MNDDDYKAYQEQLARIANKKTSGFEKRVKEGKTFSDLLEGEIQKLAKPKNLSEAHTARDVLAAISDKHMSENYGLKPGDYESVHRRMFPDEPMPKILSKFPPEYLETASGIAHPDYNEVGIHPNVIDELKNPTYIHEVEHLKDERRKMNEIAKALGDKPDPKIEKGLALKKELPLDFKEPGPSIIAANKYFDKHHDRGFFERSHLMDMIRNSKLRSLAGHSIGPAAGILAAVAAEDAPAAVLGGAAALDPSGAMDAASDLYRRHKAIQRLEQTGDPRELDEQAKLDRAEQLTGRGIENDPATQLQQLEEADKARKFNQLRNTVSQPVMMRSPKTIKDYIK